MAAIPFAEHNFIYDFESNIARSKWLFSGNIMMIQGQKSISNEQKAKMWFKKKIGASVLFWLDKHFWLYFK